jgi:hypothetical protein
VASRPTASAPARAAATRGAVERPAVWVVGSGKGGAGTSTVAAMLALALAALGRRTLLVDADEQVGPQRLLLGLGVAADGARGIGDLRAGGGAGQGADALLVALSETLTVLPAAARRGALRGGERRVALARTATLWARFACVVVDAARGSTPSPRPSRWPSAPRPNAPSARGHRPRADRARRRVRAREGVADRAPTVAARASPTAATTRRARRRRAPGRCGDALPRPPIALAGALPTTPASKSRCAAACRSPTRGRRAAAAAIEAIAARLRPTSRPALRRAGRRGCALPVPRRPAARRRVPRRGERRPSPPRGLSGFA